MTTPDDPKPPRMNPKTGKQLPKSPGRPKAPIGKGSRFQAPAAAKIVELIRAGNYPDTAACAAGVAISTFREWLKDGAQDRTEELAEFARAVMVAEAEAEVSAVKQLRRSPREARRFLERRFAKRWSPKSQVSIVGEDGGPLVVELKWTDAAGRA